MTQGTDIPSGIYAPVGFVVTLLDTRLQYGPHAARPLASAVSDKTLYFETDTLQGYQAQSGAWVAVTTASGAPKFIAASNASVGEKGLAVISGGEILTGSNDGTRLSTYSGYIILSTGNFTLDTTWSVSANSRFIGQGNQTIIALNTFQILMSNVDNVEMGYFKVSGIDSIAFSISFGAITIKNSGASHSNYFIHDIWNTSTLCTHFSLYQSGTFTTSNVIFQRCFADSPDGFGFATNGDTGTPKFNNIYYMEDNVKNAGIGANRLLVTGHCWVTGFDFAEFSGIILTDMLAQNCTVTGAWESGFYCEATPTLINIQMDNCTSRLCGQKTGDPGLAIYGAGFCIGDGGSTTLINCKDYGSYKNIFAAGGGVLDLNAYGFEGHNSTIEGLHLEGLVAGDMVKFVGGGLYSSGDYAWHIYTTPTYVILDNFTIISPTGNGGIGCLFVCDNLFIKNSYIKTALTYAFYGTGTKVTIDNCRIIATSYPIQINSASAINCVITRNDWTGCAGDIMSAAAVNPYIRGNIGYLGAPFIAKGEVVTYIGAITGGVAGIRLAVDNPYGQDVAVLCVDLKITTQSQASGTLCVGIGASNTTDYPTMFSVQPCDLGASPPYLRCSIKTVTYGVQTNPIVWNYGATNRYLNFYSHVNTTGLVANFTVTVMGI